MLPAGSGVWLSRASLEEAQGPKSWPPSGHSSLVLLVVSKSPSWRLPCAKITEVRRAGRRGSCFQPSETTDNTQTSTAQGAGAGRASGDTRPNSTPALRNPGNAEQQAGRMRASGQGPSPACRVWGKFGEVCHASGGVPKSWALLGMSPGAPPESRALAQQGLEG